MLIRNIQPEFVKRRHYWSLARVLDVIKGHDGCIRSASVLKGSADYLNKKREPEIHPIKHLFPVELNLTHEYAVSLPNNDTLLEEFAPAQDVNEDSIVEPDVQGSATVSPESETASSPQQSRRGRIIRPPKAHADYLPFE